MAGTWMVDSAEIAAWSCPPDRFRDPAADDFLGEGYRTPAGVPIEGVTPAMDGGVILMSQGGYVTDMIR